MSDAALADYQWPGLKGDPRETAAAHLVEGVPTCRTAEPAQHLIEAMRGRRFDCADAVFVLDEADRYQGLVHMNDLFAAGPDTTVGQLMEQGHDWARPDHDQEEVAAIAMRYGLIAVPVAGDDGHFLGAVPAQAITRILLREHVEDLQRIAGINRYERQSRSALEAPLVERLRRRLPWLVVGLAASTIATLIMAGFEHVMTTNVQIAFFVPGLVYIAGAIGTQSVSVAVRGLSLTAIGVGELLKREMTTGLLIGVTLGILSFPAILGFFSDGWLAAAVAMAIVGAGAISAFIGLALPWAFDVVGFDPALGSGPVCTIIQDAASLLIYFTAVSVFVL